MISKQVIKNDEIPKKGRNVHDNDDTMKETERINSEDPEVSLPENNVYVHLLCGEMIMMNKLVLVTVFLIFLTTVKKI